MKTCRERGIAVEVCPISNEILVRLIVSCDSKAILKLIFLQRLTSSMPMHPLPVLLNNGVPVALNSDDPAIFGNLNLSYDFFQVEFSLFISLIISIHRDDDTFVRFSCRAKSVV